jgi:hypothetical protein
LQSVMHLIQAHDFDFPVAFNNYRWALVVDSAFWYNYL